MKKFAFVLSAIVALFATACVADATSDVQVLGEECDVVLSLQTPDFSSRAIGEADNVDQLNYAIYDEDMVLLKKVTMEAFTSSNIETLSMRLVKNKTYNLVFWAQKSGNSYYTVNLGEVGETVNPTIEVAYGTAANDDVRDAFFGNTSFTVGGTMNETVTLTRPFAQINFGTNDKATAELFGFNLATATTKVTVSAYNTLNLVSGAVEGQTNVEFTAAALPTEALSTLSNGSYTWLAMNYILVPEAESALAACTMTVELEGQQSIEVAVPGAPARRNWRTHLVGSLLTDQANITVELAPGFINEFVYGYQISQNAAGQTVAQVNNVEGLAAVAELINEGELPANTTVELSNDIDLSQATPGTLSVRGEQVSNWTPIGTSAQPFKGTFDGRGYTIKNLVIDGGSNSNIGLFGFTTDGEIKNLTIENAKVSGRLNVGVVAGTPYTSKYTNITVKGHVEVNGMAYVGAVGGKNAYANWTNITVNVDETSYVHANSVENGTAYRTYVGGVVGFNGEGGHKFSNITSNINVKGSTCDVGGLFGIAHYNNKFENCVCTGNVLLYATDEESAGECGGIAGVWHNENGTTVTLTNCSYTGTVKATNENGDVYFEGNKLIGSAYSATGTGVLVVNGLTAVSTADELVAALEANKGVAFLNDIKIEPAKMSNAYGTTGINVKNGQTIDGNGYTLNIKGAGGTWDSGINTTGGLIKNLTVTGSFRGIFVNHNSTHSEKVVLENVTITGTVYTLSCDQGMYQNVEATNCTFNGWTSYAATIGEVKFVNCTFGKGSGYAFCRPYAKSEFVNCEFKTDYAFDTNAYNAKPELAFKGCTYNGVAITAENATSLYTGEEVFLYNGLNNLTIE